MWGLPPGHARESGCQARRDDGRDHRSQLALL